MRSSGLLLAMPSILWMLVFVVSPLVFLLCISFWTATAFGIEMEWTLDNYAAIATSTTYLGILLHTLRIAAITTAISLIVSYPVAWFLSQQRGRTKALVLLLVFLPFWTSYVVRSFVWLPMLGRSGLVNALLQALGLTGGPLDGLLYNEGTVYIGLVYVYILFMTLPIYASLERMDRQLIEAAADLGATPILAFWRVILPLTVPGIVSGCVMVFLLACGAYVTPQVLGGPSGIMFGNIIASQFLHANNWPLGAALSVVLIAVVLISLALAGRRFGLGQIFMGVAH